MSIGNETGSVFEKLSTPSDLKRLPLKDLYALCVEIRDELIRDVSRTGGHLASNLGVVELTVAMHRVFDFERDRLIFDVGHQCYVHKMLTGRRSAFDTLRRFGGLSGFPKPEESVYDAFPAGHASNSVSVALGFARARSLKNEEHNVVALIGDGALTGGLSYEALCDAGGSGEPLIIILNDNGMSITENVGGMAMYLSRERLRPSYQAFKKWFHRVTKRFPRFYAFTHAVKTAIKSALLHRTMFEEMGLEYLGPVDGHDIAMLTRSFEWARDINKPAVIHVITKKGRGYAPSEASPERFHGVSAFDAETGEVPAEKETFSKAFGKFLTEFAERDDRVAAITAAMVHGTGLQKFADKFPNRFYDVGITEGHATALAAGLAKGGIIPVFAVYSTFLQRGYDMLLHDVALSGAHAVFAVDRAGIVPGDGETHQGVYDVGYLASVPGMTVYAPASIAELRDMLETAVFDLTAPAAVRYPKGSEGGYQEGGADKVRIIREGGSFTLLTYGTLINTALDAANRLESDNVSIEIVKLGCIAPLEMEIIENSITKTGGLLVLEDCLAAGSVGERVTAALAVKGRIPRHVILLNVGARTLPCGSIDDLRRLCGLTADNICASILSVMEIYCEKN